MSKGIDGFAKPIEHSPVPWRAEERVGRFAILDADGGLVAERVLTGNIDMVNATLIVTAVNTHVLKASRMRGGNRAAV
jgi:hypothetical protein